MPTPRPRSKPVATSVAESVAGAASRVASARHLADLASRLIEYRTTEDRPDELKRCRDFARAHLLVHAPHASEWPLPESGGKPILLVSHGERPPRLLLCGHLDVVAAHDGAFTPRLRPGRGGRLYGRGAADMKGPVAALMEVFESNPLPGLGLLLTTDEEIGGMNGTEHALRCLPWRPEVVVLPDGGASMRLVVEQKGLLRLRLGATGRSVHAARPWKGRNAAELLMRAYRVLQRTFPRPRREDDWRPSVTLTRIHTGGDTGENAANAVPDHATAILDIRYPASGPDAWDRERLLQAIRQRLGQARIPIEVEPILHVEPYHLDLQSPWVARLQDEVRRLRDEGKPLDLLQEAGASDARFFGREGIPVLIFQPKCEDAHGPDECLSLDSLAQFHEILAGFVRSALG